MNAWRDKIVVHLADKDYATRARCGFTCRSTEFETWVSLETIYDPNPKVLQNLFEDEVLCEECWKEMDAQLAVVYWVTRPDLDNNNPRDEGDEEDVVREMLE